MKAFLMLTTVAALASCGVATPGYNSRAGAQAVKAMQDNRKATEEFKLSSGTWPHPYRVKTY